MALTRISPIEARVRWDRRHRPAEVSWPGRTLPVVALDAVRDERAAYPAGATPRVTMVVRTRDGGRAAIVLDARRNRWFVEAVEPAA